MLRAGGGTSAFGHVVRVSPPPPQSKYGPADWEQDASHDDLELWEAFTSQRSSQQQSSPQQLKVPSTPSNSDTAGVLDKKSTEDTLLTRIDQGMATLTSLASERVCHQGCAS